MVRAAGCADVVAAGSAGFVDELFAPQLAQVVAGLADGVAAVIDTGEGVHLGGELGDGEPVRRRGQRQGGAQRVTHAGFVEVDTADPGGTQPDAGGQLVEDAVAEESGVHTIQGGGEPLDDAGQPGDDLGKLLDHPAAAQLRGVVRDRLEPQHAFAFGVGLAGQPPEVQLEHGQVIA